MPRVINCTVTAFLMSANKITKCSSNSDTIYNIMCFTNIVKQNTNSSYLSLMAEPQQQQQQQQLSLLTFSDVLSVEQTTNAHGACAVMFRRCNTAFRRSCNDRRVAGLCGFPPFGRSQRVGQHGRNLFEFADAANRAVHQMLLLKKH